MLLAVLSLLLLGAALRLALRHPLWPHAACGGVLLWALASARWPALGLGGIAAGCAFLNFSPWSGWLAADELDLLLLSTLASGYTRLARSSAATAPDWPLALKGLLWTTAAAALGGLWQGCSDAASGHLAAQALDPFGGYTDAANCLRVAKSGLYTLLLAPLLARQPRAGRLWAVGMLAGLPLVLAGVLWERAAFVGLFDFDAPYRSVALFWEMHVGGAAIDAYLALTAPLVAWAVLSAKRPLALCGAAVLTVLTVYALLTTFSRGVYAAALIGPLLAWAWHHPQLPPAPPAARAPRWRRWALGLLLVVLLAEAGWVLGTGRFMRQRLVHTSIDLGSRLQHWQRGLATLHGAGDWLLGLGPGRLPAHYAATGPAAEFSGALQWRRGADGVAYVHLQGPATRSALGGQFALAQRSAETPQGRHRLILRLRAAAPVHLMVQWCERHLLYDGFCQTALLRSQAPASDASWQPLELTLQGDRAPAAATPWPGLPRLALLTVSVLDAGAAADLAQLQLQDLQGRPLLHNSDFRLGLAHWQLAAQSYFLPWHIDNLALELLIERGLLGLALFALLLGWALVRLLGRASAPGLGPFCRAASLLSLLCVGASSSVLDMPRVALLAQVLALCALLPRRGKLK